MLVYYDGFNSSMKKEVFESLNYIIIKKRLIAIETTILRVKMTWT